MMETMTTGLNVVPLSLSGTIKQILGYSRARVGLILPKCSGNDWYMISFVSAMGSTYCYRQDANSNSEIITRSCLGSSIANVIWAKASGAITVEITEIVGDEKCFGPSGEYLC